MELRQVLEPWFEANKESYNAIAKATGIPQPTVYRIIKGHHENPHFDTLDRICRYLGHSAAEAWGIVRGDEVLNAATDPMLYQVAARLSLAVQQTRPKLTEDKLAEVARWLHDTTRESGKLPSLSHIKQLLRIAQ